MQKQDDLFGFAAQTQRQAARLKKQAAESAGRKGEDRAIALLLAQNYEILAVRAKTKRGEIDIIARDNGIVAFVEVKVRKTVGTAHEAVSQGNWNRISNAAEIWMAAHMELDGLDWRYDLIAANHKGELLHLPDAWRPGWD